MIMSEECELREYTEEEYQADLRKELTEGCLLKAIHKRCDEINYLSSDLGYTTHRTIQEQMVEIQDLIKAYMDMQKGTEVIEFISDKLIYPLLDECDRGLWEHISHIELAEEWVKILNDNPYPKVENHTEARKRDLREWITNRVEQLKKGIE